MNLAIANNLTRSFHKVGFKLKKHSPEIFIVAGVVGTVASAVMACKATTKLERVLAESKEKVEHVHTVLEDETLCKKKVIENDEIKEVVVYSAEDGKKDLAVIYAQTGFELVKLYAPAVILGALSLTSILASNNILRKRNVALAAAYTAVDKSFKEYRGRVVERFGEALDKELRFNVKSKEIEEITVNEKGKEKIVKKNVDVVDPNTTSDYARFFDNGCAGWEKDSEYNLMFLRRQQDYANEKLRSKGHLFLNEVYDMLGIHRTKAGNVVGWIYDEKNPVGDNYVDFGIYDIHKEQNRDFVNGIERSILLDFNVDGPILDLI